MSWNDLLRPVHSLLKKPRYLCLLIAVSVVMVFLVFRPLSVQVQTFKLWQTPSRNTLWPPSPMSHTSEEAQTRSTSDSLSNSGSVVDGQNRSTSDLGSNSGSVVDGQNGSISNSGSNSGSVVDGQNRSASDSGSNSSSVVDGQNGSTSDLGSNPGSLVDEQNRSQELQKVAASVPWTERTFRNVSHLVLRNVSISPRAVCVGTDYSLGEVEDLLCWPKPNYDPSMKNPCWWENTVKSPGLGDTASSNPNQTVPAVGNVPGPPSKLSCLPYFHILCCSKSGTTDMYRRMSVHPDLVPNMGIFGKERLWWGWAKYGYKGPWNYGEPVPFSKYISGFGVVARDLETAARQNPKDLKRFVTLDGSPPDLWDLRGWIKLAQNRDLRQPAVLTPHLMKHVYRNPKFIVLVREPVERLYTSYLFHGQGRTAEKFHEDVVKAIAMFEHCLTIAQDRIECFVNDTVLHRLPVFVHFSCYSVYFAEWLKVFPMEQFLFLRTEDYGNNIKDSLLEIFQFLELPRPSTKDLQKMLLAPKSYHTKAKDIAGPMLNKTRALLHQWYRPWNLELRDLMGDSRFLWDDVTDCPICSVR